MLCDHANFLVIRRGVFAPDTAADGSILIPADAPAGILLAQRVYGIFEILGHIGFPIFIFLLTEGFLHTRSRKRYLLTLAAFAVLTEPVFDLAHYGVFWNPALQNVFFTLTVSAALLWALDGIERRFGGAPRKRWGLTPLLAAAGGLALYSGQRGQRGWKSFFYAFYPAHFLVLLWIGKRIAARSV